MFKLTRYKVISLFIKYAYRKQHIHVLLMNILFGLTNVFQYKHDKDI